MFERYVEKFKQELDFCNQEEFTGKIKFVVNFKDGHIGNMNVGADKSVKYEEGKRE